MWHVSSNMWNIINATFTCVTWRIHICDMPMYVTWLIQSVQHDTCHIHVCDMTYSRVWHDSFIRVTRLIYHRWCVTWLILETMRIPSPISYVWHDSLMCVTRLIHVCEMPHSYVSHDSCNMCNMIHALQMMRDMTELCSNRTHSRRNRIDALQMMRDMTRIQTVRILSLFESMSRRSSPWRMCSSADFFTCVTWFIHHNDAWHYPISLRINIASVFSVENVFVGSLFHTCDMTPSPQWCVRWIDLLSQQNPCRSSQRGMCFIRTQLIHMCDMTCVTWLHLCSQSSPCRSSPWRTCATSNSLTCVIWLIHHKDSRHDYVAHRHQFHADNLSGECVLRVTHSYVWHDSFTTKMRTMTTSLIANNFMPILSKECVLRVSHLYVWHDSRAMTHSPL